MTEYIEGASSDHGAREGLTLSVIYKQIRLRSDRELRSGKRTHSGRGLLVLLAGVAAGVASRIGPYSQEHELNAAQDPADRLE